MQKARSRHAALFVWSARGGKTAGRAVDAPGALRFFRKRACPIAGKTLFFRLFPVRGVS